MITGLTLDVSVGALFESVLRSLSHHLMAAALLFNNDGVRDGWILNRVQDDEVCEKCIDQILNRVQDDESGG